MRIVIQRVHSSECTVYETGHEYSPDHITFRSAIGAGLMILVGVEDSDTIDDARWLVQKASMMRIFDDEDGVMNRSLLDIGGECMCISQFTLFASTKKGNRPSWYRAAHPAVSKPLYDDFCRLMEEALGKDVKRGVFGADMKISLVNDGPVTIIMDSKNKE